jgi:nicotinamide-nucleotide amidase
VPNIPGKAARKGFVSAELISVGTELLLGQIVDTNAAYLARELSRLGIHVYRKTTVGDNPGRIGQVLREALRRAQVAILTGGLGPTQDDVTAQAVADALGRGLRLHRASAEHIREIVRRRGFAPLPSHLKQAMLPQRARVLPNPVGTAPGFLVTQGNRAVAALPGPPAEMRGTAAGLWPHLRRLAGAGVIHSNVLKFAGVGESWLEDRLADLVTSQTNPTIAFLASPAEVQVRLTANAPDLRQAKRLVAPVRREIVARAGEYLFGEDADTLESAVGKLLKRRGLTLAVAESCTGGLIGERITRVPGSSAYYLGGVVSYSNEVKQRLLGVSGATLRRHGAVSAQVARAMASGVLRALGSDLGAAVTGIAGPSGGTRAKPVGLVYAAVAGPWGVRVQENRFGGTREDIRNRAAQTALDMVRVELAKHP